MHEKQDMHTFSKSLDPSIQIHGSLYLEVVSRTGPTTA